MSFLSNLFKREKGRGEPIIIGDPTLQADQERPFIIDDREWLLSDTIATPVSRWPDKRPNEPFIVDEKPVEFVSSISASPAYAFSPDPRAKEGVDTSLKASDYLIALRGNDKILTTKTKLDRDRPSPALAIQEIAQQVNALSRRLNSIAYASNYPGADLQLVSTPEPTKENIDG